MNNSTKFDLPEMLPVLDIIYESNVTKTLVFEVPARIIENTKPGEKQRIPCQ